MKRLLTAGPAVVCKKESLRQESRSPICKQ